MAGISVNTPSTPFPEPSKVSRFDQSLGVLGKLEICFDPEVPSIPLEDTCLEDFDLKQGRYGLKDLSRIQQDQDGDSAYFVGAQVKRSFLDSVREWWPVRLASWVKSKLNILLYKIADKAFTLAEAKTYGPLPQLGEGSALLKSPSKTETFSSEKVSLPSVELPQSLMDDPEIEKLFYPLGTAEAAANNTFVGLLSRSKGTFTPGARIALGVDIAFCVMQDLVNFFSLSKRIKWAKAILVRNEVLERLAGNKDAKIEGMSVEALQKLDEFAENLPQFQESVQEKLQEANDSSPEKKEALEKIKERLDLLQKAINTRAIERKFAKELIANNKKELVFTAGVLVAEAGYLAAGASDFGITLSFMTEEATAGVAVASAVAAAAYMGNLAVDNIKASHRMKKAASHVREISKEQMGLEHQQLRKALDIKDTEVLSLDSSHQNRTQGILKHLSWKDRAVRGGIWAVAATLFNTNTGASLAGESILAIAKLSSFLGKFVGTFGFYITIPTAIYGIFDGIRSVHKASRITELYKIAYGKECATYGSRKRLERYTRQEETILKNRVQAKAAFVELIQNPSQSLHKWLNGIGSDSEVHVDSRASISHYLQLELGMKPKVAENVMKCVEKVYTEKSESAGSEDPQKEALAYLDTLCQTYAELQGRKSKALPGGADLNTAAPRLHQACVSWEKGEEADRNPYSQDLRQWMAQDLFGFRSEGESARKIQEGFKSSSDLANFLAESVEKRVPVDVRFYAKNQLIKHDKRLLIDSFIHDIQEAGVDQETGYPQQSEALEHLEALLKIREEDRPTLPDSPGRYAQRKYKKAEEQFNHRRGLVKQIPIAEVYWVRDFLRGAIAEELHLA